MTSTREKIEKAFTSGKYLDAFDMLYSILEEDQDLAVRLYTTYRKELLFGLNTWSRNVVSYDTMFLPSDLVETELDSAYTEMMEFEMEISSRKSHLASESHHSDSPDNVVMPVIREAVARMNEERNVRHLMNWGARADLRGLETQLMDLARRMLSRRGEVVSTMSYREIASRFRRALARHSTLRSYVRRVYV